MSALAEELKLPESSVSRELQTLWNNNLVFRIHSGPRTYYSINPQADLVVLQAWSLAMKGEE